MIACELHDYIEIACLYQLELILVFKDGSLRTLTAKDTGFDQQRRECLMATDEQGLLHEVVLDQLASMRAVKENPHFSEVVFVTGA